MNTVKMKHQLCTVLVTCYLLLFTCGEGRAETVDGLLNLREVLPGATEVIDVVQTSILSSLPSVFDHSGGCGSLGISLKNHASDSKEIIFMLGLAVSSAGNFPIYRLGTSKGMISQIVDIGSRTAYGFVWLYCGVAKADKNPLYFYELRISFVP